MSKDYNIEKDKKKMREIKKRNVLSFLIFLLLVLVCVVLSHILPDKTDHAAEEPVQAAVTSSK